jgi:hypothetical protein
MDALEAVHIDCPWSAIYDLNNRGIYIAVHNNFEDIAYTDLEAFGFIVYVGIVESSVVSCQSSVIVYPNPANAIFNFEFLIPDSGRVTLKIYDLHGRDVATVVDKEFPAGEHMVSFDTSGLPAGVYIWRQPSVVGRQSSAGKIIIF